MLFLNIHFFSLLLLNHKIISVSYTNFQIKSYKLCNYTQGLFNYNGNITKDGDDYYVTGRLILPVPLDDKIGGTCKIESLVFNEYLELFTIREKYLCKACNIYFGEFWYDLQRGAQVLPKTCPLQAGRYELHHHKLQFNKIALQTFPFGYLRFTLKAIDNKNPHNNLLCLEVEVYNVPN